MEKVVTLPELPRSDSAAATQAIDRVMAERNHPASPAAAARAGFEACRRIGARQRVFTMAAQVAAGRAASPDMELPDLESQVEYWCDAHAKARSAEIDAKGDAELLLAERRRAVALVEEVDRLLADSGIPQSHPARVKIAKGVNLCARIDPAFPHIGQEPSAFAVTADAELREKESHRLLSLAPSLVQVATAEWKREANRLIAAMFREDNPVLRSMTAQDLRRHCGVVGPAELKATGYDHWRHAVHMLEAFAKPPYKPELVTGALATLTHIQDILPGPGREIAEITALLRLVREPHQADKIDTRDSYLVKQFQTLVKELLKYEEYTDHQRRLARLSSLQKALALAERLEQAATQQAGSQDADPAIVRMRAEFQSLRNLIQTALSGVPTLTSDELSLPE